MVDRRIKAARFPTVKSLDSFDFLTFPSLNKALVHELIEARDEIRLLNMQKRLANLKLLIIDELGFVPLSKTGAELLFEVFGQRYERGSIVVPTNLPFDERTEVFGSESLTGALLDRLTHHAHILKMNGDSYRLRQSRKTNKNQTEHEA
jgi:DNA replication protein DnaC